MKIACDLCGREVEAALLQILDQAGQIFYVCPECYLAGRGDSPEEQP